ncbi:hypothetical protein ILUMI_25242 [Ignelater luminosus]|uniref:RNA-directed DNA polymerase n=1 Tax=Ignelater luminosus TaxID=2038154 RepID=A0A8K0FWB3_IGNLU|nr:hypothetical protein ILUMI_25242 [Ignelater luminosus]
MDNGTSTPAAAVFPVNQPATTKADKPRQRIIWSNQLNLHVMQCYYLASKLETESNFGSEILELFLLRFPDYTQVTEQRLIGQKRVIVKSNRIPQHQLQRIKEDTVNKINMDQQFDREILAEDSAHEVAEAMDRTLTKAELGFSFIYKKALAIVWAVQEFSQYLVGRHFTLCTDHKPLLAIFGENKEIPKMSAGRLQDGWPKSEAVLKKLDPFFKIYSKLHIEQGLLMWGYRLIISPKFKEQLLNEIHGARNGVAKMKFLACQYFWWSRLDDHTGQYVKTCEAYMKTVNNADKSKLVKFKGKAYLIIIDVFSKWREVYEMKGINTETTLDEMRDCFSRFGLPNKIFSDNERQFVSREFAYFCRILDFEGGMVNVKDYRGLKLGWSRAVIIKVLGRRHYLCKLLNENVTCRKHLDQIVKTFESVNVSNEIVGQDERVKASIVVNNKKDKGENNVKLDNKVEVEFEAKEVTIEDIVSATDVRNSDYSNEQTSEPFIPNILSRPKPKTP